MIKNEELMDHQQYCNSMLNIHNTEGKIMIII